jgi:hypothetical protein
VALAPTSATSWSSSIVTGMVSDMDRLLSAALRRWHSVLHRPLRASS